MAQMEAIASISALTFFINLGMVIFTSVRLKAVPYMFIKNFMVIDIINALITSGPWISGVLLDFLGKSWLVSARLQVVSNFGDSPPNTRARARENHLPRGETSRYVSSTFRARAYISPPHYRRRQSKRLYSQSISEPYCFSVSQKIVADIFSFLNRQIVACRITIFFLFRSIGL